MCWRWLVGGRVNRLEGAIVYLKYSIRDLYRILETVIVSDINQMVDNHEKDMWRRIHEQEEKFNSLLEYLKVDVVYNKGYKIYKKQITRKE